MSTPADITFVKNAIHREDEPRHFMRIKKPGKLVAASFNGQTIVESFNTLKMQEAGFDLYDPVYYFPRSEVNTELLEKSDLSTHCPLKGNTEYFHVKWNGQTLENAAFCYAYPNMKETEVLKDYIAFDQNQIQVIEYLKGKD